MSEKILIIVHVEPEFEASGQFGLQDLSSDIAFYAANSGFTRSINVYCGVHQFPALRDFERRYWLWGFDAETYLKEEPEKWIEGENYIKTTGHPYSEISNWMHELPKNAYYTLIGGNYTQCLRDIIEIWEHLKLKFEIDMEYVYNFE